MILTITSAFLLAAMKGYNLKNAFTEKSLYPFLALEAVLIVFQICIFRGIYIFVKFASVLKTLFLVSLLWPFFKFRLYKQGSIGAVFIAAGTALNKFVMDQNGGKMPVYPTLSYLTGYAKPGIFDIPNSVHVLGDAAVKYKFLTDYIDVGYSVLSIGDLLVRVFVLLIVYATIIRVCEKRKGKAGL